MLIRPHHIFVKRTNQNGVVLIIALVVLVAMTLAGIALMRSVDTSNLIAGNLAFQQAATRSADAGVEAAIAFLDGASMATLEADSSVNGYAANGSATTLNPSVGQSWDAYWVASLESRKVSLNNGVVDAAGNKIAYVIDRMCRFAGGKSSGGSCTGSPVVTVVPGNCECPGIPPNAPSVVYYRITVQVIGPRNTVSYVQVMTSI